MQNKETSNICIQELEERGERAPTDCEESDVIHEPHVPGKPVGEDVIGFEIDFPNHLCCWLKRKPV